MLTSYCHKRGWLIKNPAKSIGFIQITKKAEFHYEILLFIVNELPKKDSGVDRLRPIPKNLNRFLREPLGRRNRRFLSRGVPRTEV